jgi:hypothetical protein
MKNDLEAVTRQNDELCHELVVQGKKLDAQQAAQKSLENVIVQQSALLDQMAKANKTDQAAAQQMRAALQATMDQLATTQNAALQQLRADIVNQAQQVQPPPPGPAAAGVNVLVGAAPPPGPPPADGGVVPGPRAKKVYPDLSSIPIYTGDDELSLVDDFVIPLQGFAKHYQLSAEDLRWMVLSRTRDSARDFVKALPEETLADVQLLVDALKAEFAPRLTRDQVENQFTECRQQ